LLARRLHLTRGEARAQTDTAIALESLPQTAAAVRAGQVGLGQAQIAVQAAKDVRPDVREELDGLVAADGSGLDRRQLREHVDAWTAAHNPDALTDREHRAWANRRVSMNPDGPDGSIRGQFQLDPGGGATLIAALDAQARKTSADDDRTYPQRLADALVELARRALDAGELPQVAVQRPHVICITRPDGQARLDGIGLVSQTTAQIIACDAEITEVVMTRNGAVLDAGRTRREPTRRQRAAVIARDQVCVGCGAPAARCQIHHVRWWTRDHGPTNEDNLCLTCWSCHFNIHHNGWLIIRDPHNGQFQMYPPDPLAGRTGRRRAS
jgi:NAD-dependent dihydropyrimidine dehydrogenase PreA subunit